MTTARTIETYQLHIAVLRAMQTQLMGLIDEIEHRPSDPFTPQHILEARAKAMRDMNAQERALAASISHLILHYGEPPKVISNAPN